MKSRVYLAGPINGCGDTEARAWREEFRSKVIGVECIDPMDMDLRGLEEGMAHDIVKHDKTLIRSCQNILVNPWKPSVGTPMETLYAHILGLRIVVVAPKSPWYVAHATDIVQTIEEAAGLLSE